MRKILLIVILFNVICLACTEVYYPDVNNTSQILVVDGTITNELKEHVIYLSKAIPYDTASNSPESEAEVYVSDQNGNITYFSEKSPGEYYSDKVKFEIGYKYTLYITCKDQKKYQSSSQTLLPSTEINEINTTKKITQIYHYSGGVISLMDVIGSELTTTLNISQNNSYFRFSNSILAEYTSLKDDETILRYKWQKYNPNQYFNINNLIYSKDGSSNHDLGFFPLDTTFYGIVLDTYIPPLGPPIPIYTHRYLKNYIISIKLYHLNEDVYEFFKTANDQIQASEKYFDPLTNQIEGNMVCTSNSADPVFGYFEASSVKLVSYKVNLQNSNLESIPAIDLDSISTSGETEYTPPLFWIK